MTLENTISFLALLPNKYDFTPFEDEDKGQAQNNARLIHTLIQQQQFFIVPV